MKDVLRSRHLKGKQEEAGKKKGYGHALPPEPWPSLKWMWLRMLCEGSRTNVKAADEYTLKSEQGCRNTSRVNI